MEIRVLGPLEVSDGDERVHLPGGRIRVLLAALVASRGRVVSVDRLVHILWRGDPPPSGRRSLQAYVSRLRGVLGGGIVSDGAGYRLEAGSFRIDAVEFTELVAHAETAPCAEAAIDLDDALELWRGVPFGGMADRDFVRAERARLEELRLQAHERRAECLIEMGSPESVVISHGELVEDHPYREGLWRQLALALHRCGRRADALGIFGELRAHLGGAGLEPSRPTLELEDAIYTSDPDLIHFHGHLPQPRDSLVGRERDLTELAEVIGHRPLVTLVGPGGVGKTRLALAAVRAAELGDRSRFCDLASLASSEEIPRFVADRLVLGPHPGSAAALAESLKAQRLLLVLDNCEHLIGGVAELTRAILDRCPGVAMVVTSRERLGVEGEVVFDVTPLPSEAARELFLTRAAASRRDLAIGENRLGDIAAVCRKLDNLPLAIELAAARASTFAPGALVEELDHGLGVLSDARRHATDRQSTLEATISWSYDLLEPPEQMMFERVSMFVDGFTTDAAAAVVDQISSSAPRLLARLVEQSMIRSIPGSVPARFEMLETMRTFGLDRLAESGYRPSTAVAHLEHFVDLAEQGSVGLRGVDEQHWVAVLERETGNLRAAHAHAIERSPHEALRLSSALHFFALFRLRHEMLDWAREAARTAEPGDPLLPMVLGSAANGLANQGRLGEAARLASEAMDMVDPGHESFAIPALQALADVAIYRGDLTACISHADEIIGLAEIEGDDFARAYALVSRCLGIGYGEGFDAVADSIAELRSAAKSTGSPTLRAWAAYVEGELLLDSRPDVAASLLKSAVELARSVSNRYVTGVALVSLATSTTRQGDARSATKVFGEVIRHWHAAGDWTHQWTSLSNLVDLFVRLGAHEPAAVLYGAVEDAMPPSFGPERSRFERARHDLRDALGVDGFDAAAARGRSSGDQRIVELALDTLEDLS